MTTTAQSASGQDDHHPSGSAPTDDEMKRVPAQSANEAADGSSDDGDTTEKQAASINPFALLNGRVGGGILAVVSFWLLALCVPDPTAQIDRLVVALVAVAIGIVAIAAFLILKRQADRDALAISTSSDARAKPVELAGALSLSLFLVLVDALWIVSALRLVTVTPELRFAVGVGGSALAALAIGLLMFQNIRFAASLPIIVLFIGVAAFPQGQQLTENLSGTLIAWMASIIGVSAIAEGATQVTNTIQRGKVARSVVSTDSALDADRAHLLQEAVFPTPVSRSE